jgi:hypothetical protein
MRKAREDRMHWVIDFETAHHVCPHGDASVFVTFHGHDGTTYDAQMSIPDARVLADYVADSARLATEEAMAAEAA